MIQTRNSLLAQAVKLAIGLCGLVQAVGEHVQTTVCRGKDQASPITKEEFIVWQTMVRTMREELEDLKKQQNSQPSDQ